MLDIVIAQLSTIGGPVLVALFAVSLVALTVTIFKALQFSSLGVGRHGPATDAMKQWIAGDVLAADALVAKSGAALSLVVKASIDSLRAKPRDMELARQAATQTATQLLAKIGANLRVIEAVVQAAPMLGLLGTVIGMIEAFGKVAEGGGAADPSALAGGIWIALTTTALGLAIAIPFYFVSVWLEARVDSERAAMESVVADLAFVAAPTKATFSR
jgi:biopolymer transport protein ExbB